MFLIAMVGACNAVFLAHSHRHTLNTILRAAGVPDHIIRMITGHRQKSMTELYTHFRMEDYSEVSKITRLFL
jgi:integrase